MQAGNRGYSLMICLTKDDPDIEAECLNRLRNGLVDGILIASTGQNIRLIRDIKANGVAVVQLVRNQDRKLQRLVLSTDRQSLHHMRNVTEDIIKQ